MEYEEIAAAGGIAKPVKAKKPKLKLRAKPRIKSHSKPISIKLKKEVIREKGNLCFLGFCPSCGGKFVTDHDDAHHFPHRSRLGKDRVEDLWPALRLCHDFIHKHPRIEREMFKRIEEAGYKVTWKAKTKGIGYREAG